MPTGLRPNSPKGWAASHAASIAYPVEANEVLVRMPDPTVARLREAGAVFYDWEPPKDGSTLIRLVTSFATPEEDVANFIRIAKG